jgi:hypothetical protein
MSETQLSKVDDCATSKEPMALLFKPAFDALGCADMEYNSVHQDKYSRKVSQQQRDGDTAAINQALAMCDDSILRETLVMLAKGHMKAHKVGEMKSKMEQNDKVKGTRDRLRLKLAQRLADK